MTIQIYDLPKGMKRWWSDPARGIKKMLQDIATEVNNLVLGGITADSFFAANVQTITGNTTLSVLKNVQRITANNPGLTITLPPADSAATVFDGGRYVFINDGSTNSFAIAFNGGIPFIDVVAPGDTVELYCTADSNPDGDWAWAFVNSAGKKEIYIPAAAMRPSVSGGCANLNAIASAANQPDIITLDFDGSTQEYAQFSVAMPKSWNRGPVRAQFVWSHAAASDNRVVWSLQGLALSDDDGIANNYGTAEQVADGASSGGTANDIYITAYTPSISIGGSPSVGDVVFFRVSRVTGDAANVMAVDARLHGIRLLLTTDRGTDA